RATCRPAAVSLSSSREKPDMRKLLAFAVGAGAVFAVVVLLANRLPPSQPFAGVGPTANASAAEDGLLHWPLPPGAEAFAAIDGRRMHQDVVAQSQISRRYRDAGHPKFWGRIIGTSSDAESA